MPFCSSIASLFQIHLRQSTVRAPLAEVRAPLAELCGLQNIQDRLGNSSRLSTRGAAATVSSRRGPPEPPRGAPMGFLDPPRPPNPAERGGRPESASKRGGLSNPPPAALLVSSRSRRGTPPLPRPRPPRNPPPRSPRELPLSEKVI